jgi:hypothetical protein
VDLVASQLAPNSVLDVLRIAEDLQLQDLISACRQFTVRQLKDVVAVEGVGEGRREDAGERALAIIGALRRTDFRIFLTGRGDGSVVWPCGALAPLS